MLTQLLVLVTAPPHRDGLSKDPIRIMVVVVVGNR